jgi:hypothetical protein
VIINILEVSIMKLGERFLSILAIRIVYLVVWVLGFVSTACLSCQMRWSVVCFVDASYSTFFQIHKGGT